LVKNLQQLLVELAQLLVPAGITPKHFGELATRAFVKAACSISKCRNGRINKSRVAVLTALRRAEVTRLISENCAAAPRLPVHQPRTERVIIGWTSDKRYVNRSGNPRRLSITGGRHSFASLAKTFAGDVPHRAVLEELRRLRVVREQGRYVELTVGCTTSNLPALQSLHNVFPVLLDGIQIAAKRSSADLHPSLQRLTLTASDLVDLAVLRERASSGAISFVDGLRRSLQLPTGPPRRNKKIKHRLTVTVLLREHNETNDQEAKR
jgi:hypothetical protein